MLAKPGRRAVQRLLMRSDRLWLRLFGRSVGGAMGKAPVLVLHTVGRRTGRPHAVPLCYLDTGDGLVVGGGSGASARHPAWYYNLQAAPDTIVEIDGVRRPMHAALLSGDERERAWRELVRVMPLGETYRAKVAREIPVFRLRA